MAKVILHHQEVAVRVIPFRQQEATVPVAGTQRELDLPTQAQVKIEVQREIQRLLGEYHSASRSLECRGRNRVQDLVSLLAQVYMTK